MKRHLINFLWVYMAVIPAVLAAQSLAPAGTQSQTEPTGTPPGVAPMQSNNSRGFPAPVMEKGKPIETRAPEKSDDKPAFPRQTRVPYQATAPFVVTTLTDNLTFPWSLAFLPDGKILITEKPGTMRILDKSGALSSPLTGVPAVLAVGQVGLLDVALDPQFASNNRIFLPTVSPSAIRTATSPLRALVLMKPPARLKI